MRSTVFVTGSPGVRSLLPAMSDRLDVIVFRRLTVLVGDGAGVETTLQQHLDGMACTTVEVYTARAQCQTNLGGWKVRRIAPRAHGGFGPSSPDTARDRAMARAARAGFVLWDGREVSALVNAWRLVVRGKPIVIQHGNGDGDGDGGGFVEVHGRSQWDAFLAARSPPLRAEVARAIAAEHPPLPELADLLVPRWMC